jgi:hypothetical protein
LGGIAGQTVSRPLPAEFAVDVSRGVLEECAVQFNVMPNVRAERTTEAGRAGAAQDNGACDCPARRQRALPRRVRSRARG